MTFKQLVTGAIATFIVLHFVALYHIFLRPSEIVYVDSNKLLENYQGMKDARQEFQLKAQQWQANIDTLKAELDREIAKYESGKGEMTSKERELNEQLLQTRRKQFMDYQQGIQQKSQQEDFQMTERVLIEVNAFITEYGKQKGYKYILGTGNSGNIVYAEEEVDITFELLESLNKSYTGN